MRKLILFIIISLSFSLSAYSQCGVTVNFNYANTGCRIVSFTDSSYTTSSYNPIKWKWYFGDGDTATGPTQSHYYNGSLSSSSFDVKLVVTSEDPFGDYCTDSITKTIKINTIPYVDFFTDPNSPVCLSDTVNFYGVSNLGSAGITKWYWDFTDGGSSNIQNPSHQFADTGTYDVGLYITDTSGCTNSVTHQIRVQQPTVSYTVSYNPASTLDTLQFNGYCSDPVLDWTWDFGDGTSSAAQNPLKQYASNGTYLVTLSALTTNLCTPSVTDTEYVETLPYCNFSFTGQCLGEPTTFTDQSYSVSSGIKKWVFSFGDGIDSTILISDIHVQHPTVAHTYAVAGVYTVTLTVYNSYGNSKIRTKQVVIVPKSTANFSYKNTCQYDTTDFYDQTNDTAVTSWQWNLGDGNIVTTQNVAHKYFSPGTYPVQLIVMNKYGCGDTATKNVTIDSLPPVSITMSNNKLCLGEQEQLYGNDGTDTVTWHWNLGNGDTSNYQNPLPYTYSASGTYYVTLKVVSNHNCSNTVTDSVIVMDNPTVDFSYGPQACKTDSVSFVDKTTSSSGILTSFAWNFGDTASAANQTTQENPKHYFTGGAGSYKVQLLATNSFGCSDSTSKFVKIYDTPKAGFTYIQQASPMTQVSFTDTSKQGTNYSPISSYLWTFYQNDTSLQQNPSYNFPKYDTCYSVMETVTDTNGCSNTDTSDVCLLPPPPVDFTISQDSVCLGESITFSGQATNIAKWHWDFGDGDTSNYQNPLPHTYLATGTYSVTLSVIDNNGYSNSVTHKVYVFGSPTVDFSYGPQTCQTDTVAFTDNTTTPSGGLSSFAWDFGDPTSTSNQSTIQNPKHFFSGMAGSYKVQLVATNSFGCKDSTYKYVKIYDTPKAGFTYIQQASPMTQVSFTDTSQQGINHSPINSYLWTFYQNDTSLQQNPSYNFPNYGQCYPVTLTVTDTNGCSNTDTTNVCLVPPPPVDFTVSKDSICLGESITFTGQATNIAKWHWDFGNGDTSNYQNPVYKYLATGTYSVTLSVTDVNGYSNSVTHKVYVFGNPTVDFSYGPQTCQTDTVAFTDKTTTPSGGLSAFAWDFGDPASSANQSTLQNPKHFFSGMAGSYKVKLIATNSLGCSDSTYKYVKIYDSPKAGFTYIQQASPMTQVSFTDTSLQGTNHSPISSYLWTFYLNDTSLQQNPSYNFPKYDTCYSVLETVTDTNGCSNTDTSDVCLVPPPPVDFTVSKDSICLGESITFTGQATNIAKWHWDFGNGDTSNYQNPVYKYLATGTYSVTLSVTNNNGYSNSVTHKVYVFGNPTVDFSYGPQTCQTDTVAFTDNTTTPSGGLSAFAWDFGDPASSANQSTLQNPKHFFSGMAGSYKVKLLVTNSLGCSDSTYKYVKIYDSPKAGFTYIQQASPMTQVSFTDTSLQGTNHSPISSYLWTFYLNDTSLQQNPSYNFPNYGQCYSVMETVTDTNGCSNTDTSNVCLVPPPPVDFTVSKDSVCLGESITFTGQATNITKWHWDFGNGDTSNYQNPVYEYLATGTYSVTLSVIDVNGYSNSVTHKVYVFGNPKANFTFGTACKTDSVSFLDATTNPSGMLSSFKWDFDDPTSISNQSALQNPKHFFSNGTGSYHVKLYVANNFGCSDSVYKYVKVHDDPKAGFTYIQQASPMTQVSFTDTSKMGSDGSPINSYLWSFYNGDVSNSANPTYNFPNYGQCYPVTLTVSDTNGCSNIDTVDVCLLPPPPVDFTMSNDTICLGESITFSGQATNIVKWHWDFGDGDTSNYQNPVYKYDTAKTYTVTLSVTDVNGFSNSVTHKVLVSANPVVDFSYGPQACQTDSVSFFDNSTVSSGVLTSFAWNFGDTASTANQSTLQNPKHFFSGMAGSYKIQLLATNSFGCSDSATKNVKIYDSPKAGFTYIQQSNPMTQVNFSDTSKQSRDRSPIVSYLWTFYNGDVADSANPIYDFPNYGQCYSVTETVTDTNGCSNTDTVDVCLVSPPPVDFTASPDSVCQGESISFSGQASNIAKWHWDFGDGDTSTYQNPTPHTYLSFGTYIVTLTVTDVNGFSNSISHKVYVFAKPTADFSYGRACENDSVFFSNSTSSPTGFVTSFGWDFGDTASSSNQSTQQLPVHYFSGGAGSYHVKLYVTNNSGCSDTIYKYVKVHNNPKAGFTYIQQVNPMTKVNFTDTSQMSREGSPISSYLWNFYNGDLSDSANPSYNFPSYGQCYPVTLTVTDTNGCSNTDTTDVCLLPPPPVDFTMSNDSACLGEKITFSGLASNIASWHWDFGDGDTSNYQNPLPYVYLLQGTYTVKLTVTDINGFTNSVSHKIFIAGNPDANFTFGSACQTDSVYFYDMSTTSSGLINSFNWNFDDSASTSNLSTQQNPAHYFSSGAGSYHVKLYVSNNYGCTDTIYKYVKVHDNPQAGFTYKQQINPMTTVSFTDTSHMSRERSPISSYLWSFYNGDVSDSVNPSYNFPSDGQCYPVTLTVTDTNGCSNTDTTDVCLLPPPPVDILMSADSICLGEKITFSGQASNIVSWHWDFGDGDTSDYQNQVYQYPGTGTYTVTLSVTDINGFSNSVTHQVFVAGNPTANFSYDKACEADSVSFLDQTLSPTGVIKSYNWNFGDSTSLSNQSTQQNPSHLFSNGAGSYHVKLYVTNNFGCSDTIYKYVKVHAAPKAGFTYLQQNNPMTLVSFTDTSHMSRERSPISSYLWSFYNGDVSDSANPSYNFPSDGQCYPISLTVTDTNGCSNTDTTDVCLLPPPPVDFTISDDSICLGEKITFSGLASNIVSWHWDFGDGDTSIYQNPLPYVYPSRGTYTVKLTVTDINGFTNSITHNVFVSGNPKANFSSGTACQTDSVHFLDGTSSSTGVITAYDWDFGDPGSAYNKSSQQNPVHFFSNGSGSYHVKLYVTNNFGCSDSIYKYVKVHDNPKAGFSYVQQSNPMTLVSFTDTSQLSRERCPIKSYLWSFYNGDISDSANPSYNFPGDGQCYPVTLMITDTNGCTSTDTADVCLFSPPPVDFTISDDSICLGEKITFTGVASKIVRWHWDFGNGDTSFYQSPLPYAYSSPGTYTVKLTVTDINGFTNSITHKVFVSANPKVDFSYGRACQTDSVRFYNETTTASGILTDFNWNFGDPLSGSNQSTLQNPLHSFIMGYGSYHVRLYVTNNYGCTDTVYKYIRVHDNPTAGFSYKQLGNPLTAVSFTDTSLESRDRCPISSHVWNFYNGIGSDSVNPTYNFPNNGQCYPVTLTVTDTNQCSNTTTVDVCLLRPPSLDFTQSTVCLGTKTHFAATYTTSLDTIGYYFKWDFDDGSNPVYTYYDTITHQFNQPGAYNVQVTAVGTNGSRITAAHQTTVDSLPNADFTFITPSCDQATTFEAPTWGGGCPIKTWSWDFGDSSSGSSDTSDFWNPSHLYPSIDSTFTVSLTVTNANGCVNTAKKPVARSSCAFVYFTVADTRCSNNPVYFKDRTSLNTTLGKIDQWVWDFGDGTTKTYSSHQDSVSHVYQSAGSYKVTLNEQATVNNTTSYGSYDSVIVINQSPQANFGFGPACIGQPVYFDDSTWAYNSGLRQWQWNFNDPSATDNTSGSQKTDNGNTSNLQNPVHVYSTAGSFLAQLVVSDDYNCVDTAKKNVVVHGPPTASFNINPNYNGVPGQIYLENTSIGAVSYLWKFGDGSSSSQEDPIYQYSSSDPFTAMLIATSQYSCSDTATNSFDLTAGLYVPNSFAPGSTNPKIDLFKPKGVNLRKYEIRVYSAWGILLWESTKLDSKGSPVEGWDGTFKGQPMPPGDYIWSVNAEFLNGKAWQGSDNGDGNKKPYGRVLLIR